MSVLPATLALNPGSEVLVGGRRGVITRAAGLDAVLVRDVETGQVRQVNLVDLKPVPVEGKTVPVLEAATDEDLQAAQKRLDAIRPLTGLSPRKREDVESRAQEVGVHPNTLYKWLKLYEGSLLLTSLLPRARKDAGAKRLPPEVEAIVDAAIDQEYLQKQRKSASNVFREIDRRCHAARLDPPHINTIRNRIRQLSAELKVARRHGRKAAEARFSPIDGAFPGADWPLAVVQIDHTKLDIILVDDIHRHPIGRPWITLAIDVFSRMVAGFYISFDPPGAVSTGLCIAHAVLPKETALAKQGIDGEWPCWGLPKTLHLDNAKEFRGAMLERACRQYGINIEWRPVARPHFGGHIERLLGTLSREIHTLPGTTFANPRERGEYDSEGTSALTLAEFETWLTTYIVQVYHQRPHSSLGMPPIAKFKEGVFGTASRPGTGLAARILDEDRLRLDFMPFQKRTVQDYGVVIDKVHYWHDVLRRWVNAPDSNNPKVKREFIFKRDPRDISTIWFFDPEVQAYYPIPYRDTSHPAISLWELREANRRLEDEGIATIDEAAIFAAYGRMREIEEQAKAKTKAARRSTQRRKMGIGATAATISSSSGLPAAPKAEPSPPTDIQPFDEMDDLSP